MSDILKEILKKIPDSSKIISDACFEGANIVLYSKDKDFIFNNKNLIKELVNEFKKRIELRPDPSLTEDLEKSKEDIEKIIPAEAEVENIIFDPQRSRVIIEAKKPGAAIGKDGSVLQEIKKKTFWVPVIRRTPPIKSKVIEDIRSVLYQFSDYRRKFLNQVGHRIYDGWTRARQDEWVRLTMMGAGRQVGRSCLLLQTAESRILLDAGIDVSATDEKQAYPYFDIPEFRINEIDAIVISHSHLDHCGFLPVLFKFGYRGPVYCTSPTRDVMALSLLDFLKIMHSENKDSLFSLDDIREVVKHTICLDYEEVTDITPDVRLTLYNSGHILGSAMAHFHIGNGLHNLLYTADLKFEQTALLSRSTTIFPRLETLIIESTYGGAENEMPQREDQDKYLLEVIKATVERGGKILMPVLSSGKAQEVMVIVESLIRQNLIPKLPVYIDGLLWDVTAIHTAYPEFLNKNMRQQILQANDNPFLSDIFKRVGSPKERKQVLEETGPCIILATSGMLAGGPSVEYFKNLAEDKRHSLVFSCYQGPGTLGRRLQNGEKEIMFQVGQKQQVTKVNLEVHKLELSGHSSRRQLMNFIKHCNPMPRKVIINHGESSRCLDLASSIHKKFNIETVAPRNLETIRIR